jgi:hypothetical protein
MQVLASANGVYEIPWPTSFAAFLDFLKVFLVDLVTISRTNCAERYDMASACLAIAVQGLLGVPWGVPCATSLVGVRFVFCLRCHMHPSPLPLARCPCRLNYYQTLLTTLLLFKVSLRYVVIH